MQTLRLIVAIAAATIAAAACSPSRAETGAGGDPVLVELFTSQGCASCPPADDVLRHLGPDAIPLAFHVDYWDQLGWADPLASPRWATRQAGYTGRLHTRGMYTPQAVVNGVRDVVGSDADGLGRAIRELAARPAKVAVDVTVKEARTIEVTLEVRAPLPRPADVLLAVTEDGLRTEVRRGENAGMTLRNDDVVRALVALTCTVPKRPGRITCRGEVPAALRARASAVTIFVQDRETRAVLGAGRGAVR